jgi:DNA-directed RNA polymerase subunit RPC12/RpoP
MNKEKSYKCPNCGQHKLYFVPDYEPYWDEHMICEYCHSTYNMFDLIIKKLLDENSPHDIECIWHKE